MSITSLLYARKINMRTLSKIDRFICEIDKGLKTLASSHQAKRENPGAKKITESELSASEMEHSAALMRINHCGEVCAQALYQGQALTARNRNTQESMQDAADEEIDHLVWCEERIKHLNSRTSYLNPLWYGLSFSLGAATGLLGDKISLGFVEATEDQVCQHLEEHLELLPEEDHASREILKQMLIEEEQHGQNALNEGGQAFAPFIKQGMRLASKVMTKTSYYI